MIHGTSEVYSAVRTVARDTLGLTQPEQASQEDAEDGAASDNNHQSREELKSGVWTFDLDQKLFESSISAIQVNLISLLYKAIDKKYPRPFASKLLLNKVAKTQTLHAILILYYQGLFMWLGFLINALSFEIWSQMQRL